MVNLAHNMLLSQIETMGIEENEFVKNTIEKVIQDLLHELENDVVVMCSDLEQ